MSRNALQSMIDGTNQGKREQTVLTPMWLVNQLVADWCQMIHLDPCAASENPTHVGALEYRVEPDGLTAPWPAYTYCNPPYDQLKLWLAFALEQPGPWALLCPVRPHRTWYRQACAKVTAIIEFNPFPFVGFKAAFPAPLALLCRNWNPDPARWSPHGVRFIDPALEFPC